MLLSMCHSLTVLILVQVLAFCPNAVADTLFTLSRSTNKNMVRYDLDNNTEAKSPISVFWQMLEDDGAVEGLNRFERDIYGVELVSQESQKLIFKVKALPTYVFTVFKDRPAKAVLRLLGQEREVSRIFLQVSGGLFPSVKTIEIFCATSTAGGEEKIVLVPNGKDGWTESKSATL
jgi:hypothetical protein